MSYLINKLGTANQNPVGQLFTQTASATVANTVTETAISSTGEGSLTLPADFFIVGRSLRFMLRGYHSSSGNPTINVKIKFGSTVIMTTGAITSGNGSNSAFLIDGFITCRTTGSSGTVFGQGFYEEVHSNGARASMTNTSATTINTTTTQAISVTVTWGTASASNTLTATNFVLEALN